MASDGLGGLVCTLSDDHQTGAARASDPDEALADLLGALDNAAIKGSGECFWLREAGQYRWVIRRHDKTTARFVVLWSSGTMTGWENVFWRDGEWAPLDEALRTAIAGHQRRAAASA